MWSDTLPDKLKGICDEEEYRKTQLYQKDNNRLSFWSSTFNVILIVLMICTGGFALVDDAARSISKNPILISLLFFGIIGLVSDLSLIHISEPTRLGMISYA